jgi:hypothetical protein
VNLVSAGFSGDEVISLGNNVLLRVDSSLQGGTYASYWDGSSYRQTTSGQSLGGSGWRHIAYTFDDVADQQFLYIDGVEAGSSTFATSISYTQASNTTIGAYPSSSSYDFNGQLDDLRIYDRALTASEISDLAALGGGGGGGGGSGGGGTFRDEFNTAGSYAGNDGTLSWAGDWLEINEADGPNSGDELVKAAPVSGFLAQVQDNDGGGEGLQREADLSGHSTANLTFTYWRGGLDNANDYVTIDVSADGGTTWTEVGRLTGPASDAQTSPQSASFDISAHISPNTRIRFLTSPNMGSADRVYFDDIQIEVN